MKAPFHASLVRSKLLQIVDLGNGNKLCVNPLSGGRIYATDEIVDLIESFRTPQNLGEWVADRVLRHGSESGQQALSCVLGLQAQGFLFDTARGDETQYWTRLCAANVARASAPGLARISRRFRNLEVSIPRKVHEYGNTRHRMSMLFFGTCNAQLLVDFVREIASASMVDAAVRATIFQDFRLAADFKSDVIVVGQFAEKVHIFEYPSWGESPLPTDIYINTARDFLTNLRQYTRAPVLLLNLPTPSCVPLGRADRGVHINLARKLNLELAELASEMDDVLILDVDQVLGLEGRRGLIDDAVAGFGHLGSLPWLVHQYQNPDPGMEAYSNTLGSVPDVLARAEFETERIIASEIVSIVLTMLGVNKRKCVVVDLDDTLWPGAIADNSEPFAGRPAFDIYPYGRYWGLHSALKALKARGLLLACVSKNDEEVVRRLWRYEGIPSRLFLTLEDFVTIRINWNEKSENIESIARELNLGLEAVAFIDDNALERAKVEQFLPDVFVLGGEPYLTRWILINDPAFQVMSITPEAARRTEMTKGQIEREHALAATGDMPAFLKTLDLVCIVERVGSSDPITRIRELLERTHQFNTTGRKWSTEALGRMIRSHNDTDGQVYVFSARDRFVDYGLVGVCVIESDTIENLVVSCRALGLGLEDAFLSGILGSLQRAVESVDARYVPTDRNLPARKIYPCHGFQAVDSERWRLNLRSYVPPRQLHIRLTVKA